MDKYIVVYDDDNIYFTDLETRCPFIGNDMKVKEYDTEEDMLYDLNYGEFRDYYEED